MRAAYLVSIVTILALPLSVCGFQQFEVPLTLEVSGSSGGSFVLVAGDGFDFGLPAETENALQTPSIQSALDLSDEQTERIKTELEKLQRKFQPQYERIDQQQSDEQAKQERMNEVRKDHREAVEMVAEQILLPHQMQRLRQLQNRSKLQRSFQTSEYDQLAESLNLTASQKKELAEKSAEMRAKLAEEIKALKQKRSQEVLESVLTKEQKEQLDELLGEPLATAKKK